MSSSYKKLTREDFDAIVTGELTHYNLWMEDIINEFILGFFLRGSSRKEEFKTIFFDRDCLTFQDKLDLVKASLKRYSSSANYKTTSKLFDRIETFKSLRNAFAHGTDYNHNKDLRIIIKLTARGGKEKTIEVTPDSHSKTISEAENLLTDLQKWKNSMLKHMAA